MILFNITIAVGIFCVWSSWTDQFPRAAEAARHDQAVCSAPVAARSVRQTNGACRWQRYRPKPASMGKETSRRPENTHQAGHFPLIKSMRNIEAMAAQVNRVGRRAVKPQRDALKYWRVVRCRRKFVAVCLKFPLTPVAKSLLGYAAGP